MDKGQLGRRIGEARKVARMTQDALGEAVGLDRTAISRLEKGERRLDINELLDIARALDLPLSFFVDESVPAVVSRRQDAANAHPSTNKLDQALQHFASDVRAVYGMRLLEPVTRPRTTRVPLDHRAAEAAASEVRARGDLGTGPLLDLATVCEQFGLYSFSVALGEDGADGGCAEVSEDAETVGAAVINGDAPAGRRRMTLAHELGHWLFGDAYDARASAQSERMINSFAIHFLAPRAGVHALWNQHHGWSARDRALTVGAGFRLSWSAAVGQLKNLNLLTAEEHRTLATNEPRSGEYLRLGLRWSDELVPPSLSPRFSAAVLNAYSDARLTSARAIELLRGTLAPTDLPELPRASLDELRHSFAGHDG